MRYALIAVIKYLEMERNIINSTSIHYWLKYPTKFLILNIRKLGDITLPYFILHVDMIIEFPASA